MKATISSLSEIQETLRSEYEPKDGKFVLKLEGDMPGLVTAAQLAESNTKLAEFRDNNRSLNALKSELETSKAALEAKIGELQKTGVKEPADVEAKIAKAVQEAVGPLATQLRDLQKSEADAKLALSRRELESSLTSAGLKAGVDEKALPDYLNRGLSVFKHKDGKILATNGDTPLYSKKNGDPLSVDEWASGLSAEAPHLFKPSKGGGASPGHGGIVGARKVISNDPLEFGRNLESIAKGETIVAPS